MSRLILMVALAALLTFCSESSEITSSCATIHVRSPLGWWLGIDADGSGTYGFGALPARVNIQRGSFEFEELMEYYELARNEVALRAEQATMTFACLEPGQSAAVQYRLAADMSLLNRLFSTARRNTSPPRNELEVLDYEQIDQFWQDSSWQEGL